VISICIPTYNRADLLDRCLSRIEEILTGNNPSQIIEVCVSDNGSSDHTREVIARHQPLIKHFRSTRHDTNLGFARNFISALQLATQEWIAVLGDDDQAIDRILETLVQASQSSKDLVILASENGERKGARDQSERTLSLSSPKEVLRTVGIFQLTFIGNLVFRRSAAQPLLANLTTDSAYPQTILAWKLAYPNGADFIDKPIVVADYAYRPWVLSQPLYTSLDMARILTDAHKHSGLGFFEQSRIYLMLLRSLPRAIVLDRLGKTKKPLFDNPYHSLNLKHVGLAYQNSWLMKWLASIIFFLVRWLPLKVTTCVLFPAKENA